MMAWSNETVLEFVELYKNEEVIWDPKHISHRNRLEVNEAWERIRNNISIDCTVIDLKKKKESLMTAFRSHLNRKRKCPDYRPSWFAYSQLESFLGGRYECDSTHPSETEFTTSYNINQTSDPLHLQGLVSNSPTAEKQDNAKLCRPPTKQQTLKRLSQTSLQTNKKEESHPCNEEKLDTDECDLYCQLLAKKLKKLDEHQRDVVMHEIDNLLFRAKMESAQVNYPGSSSPIPRKIKSPVFIVTAGNNTQFNDDNTYPEHPAT